MLYRLFEVKVPLDYSHEQLPATICRETGMELAELVSWSIVRRSLDARHTPCYNLTLEFETTDPLDIAARPHVREHTAKKVASDTPRPTHYTGPSPVVIGAGPAGLMATLALSQYGLKPVLYERGAATEMRSQHVHRFWNSGDLNTESNMLFGEGGAGLFSDGKLTARTKDRETTSLFFKTLVACGAPESILIDAEPHLGSDCLLEIIPALRQMIVELGGTVMCDSHLDDLDITDGRLKHLSINNSAVAAEHCILATGHSARDVYTLLAQKDVALEAKPSAMGVRLELPQEIVNQACYGKHAGMRELDAASFRLTRKATGLSRAAYSFCMCPGGEVVACASSAEMLTTNGMSLSARAGQMANAALLVPVTADDYEAGLLGGVALQQQIERQAFVAGGGDYSIPVESLSDFLNKTDSPALPPSTSCRRVTPGAVHSLLPDYICDTLQQAIPELLPKLGNPSPETITVYGAETRSSSPVRIVRDPQTMMSTTTSGLFPCGEGAGYAGGIVSSALDGIRAARSLVSSIA